MEDVKVWTQPIEADKKRQKLRTAAINAYNHLITRKKELRIDIGNSLCAIKPVGVKIKNTNEERAGLHLECKDKQTEKVVFSGVDGASSHLDGVMNIEDKEIFNNDALLSGERLYHDVVKHVNKLAEQKKAAEKKAEQKKIVDAMMAAEKK